MSTRTKIAMVADVHLGMHAKFGGPLKGGLNRRAREGVAALACAVQMASRLGVSRFYSLGDLFDTTLPKPQLIAAAQDVLHDEAFDTCVLLGNHEQESTDAGDHALAPLAPIVGGTGSIVAGACAHCWSEKDSRYVEVWCVPFMPGPGEETLPAALEMLCSTRRGGNGNHRVLLLHLGLIDDSTPPWLRGAHDAVRVDLVRELMRKHEIHACFAGNWHEHRVCSTDPHIVQVGALVPTGWDNPGLTRYGSLIVYDAATNTWERTVIPGPRFIDVQYGEVLPNEPTLYVRVRATAAERQEAGEWLTAQIDAGLVVAGEVLHDTAEVKAAARTAATAARSSATIEEALARYVAEASIEGVDRGAVLAACRKYLRLA